MFGAPLQQQQLNYNTNNDTEVLPKPDDGVSTLCWSPATVPANYLVAGMWDNTVRLWEVLPTGQQTAKAQITHQGPVLCSAFHSDGASVFSAGCDKMAKRWDLASNQDLQVAQHDAPIRHLAWVPEMQMLITGSWDKTLRYWDLRQPTAAAVVPLADKCYAMSCVHPMLVVGTADRHIQIFNLQAPQQVYKQVLTPLKYQTRCVACFPDKSTPGYLVGSIEGRVAVQHVEDNMSAKNFTFKCHREDNEIYSVNSLCFHPTQGTFVTTGSDGTYNFWDKENKQRLKAMSKTCAPIPCASFNKDGSILAYAVSYDWSKGADHHNPATASNHILMHAVQESEVKQRRNQRGGRN